MKNQLMFTIENPYGVDTPLAKCVEVLTYAVGTYNSDVDVSPYRTGKEDWKAYLSAFIRINERAFDDPKGMTAETKRDYFGHGFGHNHFFLQDLEGERVVIITPTILD